MTHEYPVYIEVACDVGFDDLEPADRDEQTGDCVVDGTYLLTVVSETELSADEQRERALGHFAMRRLLADPDCYTILAKLARGVAPLSLGQLREDLGRSDTLFRFPMLIGVSVEKSFEGELESYDHNLLGIHAITLISEEYLHDYAREDVAIGHLKAAHRLLNESALKITARDRLPGEEIPEDANEDHGEERVAMEFSMVIVVKDLEADEDEDDEDEGEDDEDSGIAGVYDFLIDTGAPMTRYTAAERALDEWHDDHGVEDLDRFDFTTLWDKDTDLTEDQKALFS